MSQSESNGNGGPSQSRVMTLTEFAQLMRISRSTAWELYRTGRLPVPVLRLGTQLRLVRLHVEQYLESGEFTMKSSQDLQ